MSSELEDLMAHLGTGPWNFLQFISVAIGAALPPPHALASAFFSPNVGFTCRAPVNTNITESSCSYSVEDPVTGRVEEDQCTEWDFDNSTFTSTVTSEYQLVCSRNSLRAIYQSLYMFGVFVGSPFNGVLADRYGRKPLVVGGSLMFTFIAIGSVWITDFSVLLASRFFIGLSHSILMKTAQILAMEVSAPNVRSAANVFAITTWSLNTIVLSGVAYQVRDWRTLQLIMSLAGLLHLPFLWFIDESPRWLAVSGQHLRALTTLKRAARWNKVTLPPEEKLIEILNAAKEQAVSNETSSQSSRIVRVKEGISNLFILFRTARLRKITFVSYLIYLVLVMVYFGLSFSGANLSSNVFVYMALMGLVDIPPCITITYLVSRIGRRASSVLHLTLSGIMVLALPFIPKDIGWLTITFAVLGKMYIAGAYKAFNLFACELFPTEVRTQGITTSYMMSRIGAMAAPFITDLLGSVYPWAPPVVFGVAAVVAALAAMTLPETLGMPLSDTIAHLEGMEINTKSRGFFRLPVRDPDASKEKSSGSKTDEDSEGRSLTNPPQEH